MEDTKTNIGHENNHDADDDVFCDSHANDDSYDVNGNKGTECNFEGDVDNNVCNIW